jgi:hypothetical protein
MVPLLFTSREDRRFLIGAKAVKGSISSDGILFEELFLDGVLFGEFFLNGTLFEEFLLDGGIFLFLRDNIVLIFFFFFFLKKK